MRFKDFQELKNNVELLKNKDIPEEFVINGWTFEKIKAKIIESKIGNIQTWEIIYTNSQIEQSILLNVTVRYIKTKDELRIRTINNIELY
jgi:hypothetical protein